jgi:hypothetical protein
MAFSLERQNASISSFVSDDLLRFIAASASSGFDDHPAIKEPILNLIQPKNQNEQMQSRPRT